MSLRLLRLSLVLLAIAVASGCDAGAPGPQTLPDPEASVQFEGDPAFDRAVAADRAARPGAPASARTARDPSPHPPHRRLRRRAELARHLHVLPGPDRRTPGALWGRPATDRYRRARVGGDRVVSLGDEFGTARFSTPAEAAEAAATVREIAASGGPNATRAELAEWDGVIEKYAYFFARHEPGEELF